MQDGTKVTMETTTHGLQSGPQKGQGHPVPTGNPNSILVEGSESALWTRLRLDASLGPLVPTPYAELSHPHRRSGKSLAVTYQNEAGDH